MDVDAILDAHSPASPAAPGRPVKTSGLSMTPNAQRLRARRAAAKNTLPPAPRHGAPSAVDGLSPVGSIPPAPVAPAGSAEPAGEKFTPSHLQLMPDGPARTTGQPSPEQLDKAVRDWAFLVRGAGLIASKIWKSDALQVPEPDARDCAEAILDGWPELALASDGDWKKLMAVVTVGSVGSQRLDAYRADKVAPPAAAPRVPAPAASSGGVLPMHPVSM